MKFQLLVVILFSLNISATAARVTYSVDTISRFDNYAQDQLHAVNEISNVQLSDRVARNALIMCRKDVKNFFSDLTQNFQLVDRLNIDKVFDKQPQFMFAANNIVTQTNILMASLQDMINFNNIERNPLLHDDYTLQSWSNEFKSWKKARKAFQNFFLHKITNYAPQLFKDFRVRSKVNYKHSLVILQNYESTHPATSDLDKSIKSYFKFLSSKNAEAFQSKFTSQEIQKMNEYKLNSLYKTIEGYYVMNAFFFESIAMLRKTSSASGNEVKQGIIAQLEEHMIVWESYEQNLGLIVRSANE